MQKKLWNRDFILLLQSSAVSTIGDVMYGVAIGYWVYEKTGSTALMGIMSSISMFVTVFLLPFCGSIVDRCSRKWVIVGVDLLQGVLMLAVGILAYLDALNVPIVLLAALLASFGGVLYSPAKDTVLLDIIPRSDMVRGQSLNSGLYQLIQLVGSAFSGAMVAFFGVPLIVVLNGVSNLYSALSEALVRVPKTLRQGEPVSLKQVWQDTKAAMKTVFSHRFLKLFVPAVLIGNLLVAGQMSLLLPVCMDKGFSVEQYGYLTAIATAGSLLSVLILGVVKLHPKARYWVMTLGFSCAAPFLMAAYLTRQFPIMAVLLFIGLFCNSAGNTILSAALMLALPEENRSSILGWVQSAITGGCALSVVLYGFLGELIPLHLAFAAGNLLALVPILYLGLHAKTKEFIRDNHE